MISNASLTLYHKGFDTENHKETWTRFNYSKIWWFDGKGAGISKGYDGASGVEVRIDYALNPDINNFSIGDILVKGTLDLDITKQQDLEEYKIYNITNIKDNNFGNVPHIHLTGN